MSKNFVSTVIALGSNLGDRQAFLQQALEAIATNVGSIEKQSSVYQTPPLVMPNYQGPEVADYLNMAIVVRTELSASQLLVALHQIEKQLGRNRKAEQQRWLSRVIDLDIIFYGDQVIETQTLKIPHPEMHKRDFVLKPMMEIAANWHHPLFAKTVSQLFTCLDQK